MAVIGFTLPASLVAHFLPAGVRGQDFSGSLWHGSAGNINVNGRDAGAVEWRLRVVPLLFLTLDADLHWVKGGFVLDARTVADRNSVHATNVQGGGPIADLRDLGVAPGWSGTAKVQVTELRAALAGRELDVQSAIGDIFITDLTIAPLASGADLGGYSLHFADPHITPDSDASADLADTGGPLALAATIHYSGRERRGILSGTVKERPDAPAALRGQLQNLAQLHARDTEGRIPIDLEFTL